MYSAEIIAKRVCQLSNWQITNIELQKILYIINMFYLGLYDKQLIKESFEAWTFGPVVPKLYYKVKLFGPYKIKKWRFDNVDNLEDEAVDDFVYTCYEGFKGYKPFELVAFTHVRNGGWAKNYNPEYNVIIPNEDIKEEFEQYYAKRK